jgi:hypothetical protein
LLHVYFEYKRTYEKSMFDGTIKWRHYIIFRLQMNTECVFIVAYELLLRLQL